MPAKGQFQSLDQAFWRHVDKGDGGSKCCWEWRARIWKDNQYGRVNYQGQTDIPAHRFAYELLVEPLGDQQALHKCDNPLCVRADPDPEISHIFPGTVLDNMRDKVAKGRQCRGERHHSARLTDDQRVAVRELYGAGRIGVRELARLLDISPPAVRKILFR